MEVLVRVFNEVTNSLLSFNQRRVLRRLILDENTSKVEISLV